MPNWCESELTISGNKEDVSRCIEFIRGENGVLDFEKIIPTPEIVKTVPSGTELTYGMIVVGDNTKEAERVLAYEWVKKAGVTTIEGLKDLLRKKHPNCVSIGEMGLRALKETGFTDWYDWRVANWGTKWNASDPVLEADLDKKAVIGFSTAWSPALPVIEALSGKFPDLKFTLKYWERGMGFKGTFECKSGEVVNDKRSKYSGPRGG